MCARRAGRLQRLPIKGVQVLSVLSASVLLGCFFWIPETIAWPNALALVPTLATTCLLVLLHLFGSIALPGFASWQPLQAIGRCSYSLYLWHWPILGALIYTNSDFGTSWLDYLAYCVLVGVFTWATYALVEQKRQQLRAWHAWVILVAFCGLSLAASGYEQSPKNFPPEVQRIVNTGAYAENCVSCTQAPSRAFVVLWGDSHSQMLVETVERVSKEVGLQLVHIKGSLAEDRRQLLSLASSTGYTGMIVAARWSMYAVGFPADEPEEQGTRYLPLDGKQALGREQGMQHFQIQLDRFLNDFSNQSILLLLEVPRYAFFPKKELLMQWASLRLRALPVKTLGMHQAEQQETRTLIEQLAAKHPTVELADPAALLCAGGTCTWHAGWDLLYKDDDHLSVYGSEKLRPLLEPFLFQRILHAK
ncbi:MAG: acyltransferase [Limnobacter sp.]|nr:acyltransferase [Limnobacter sp.]